MFSKAIENVMVYLMEVPSLRNKDVELISNLAKTVVTARYISYFLLLERTLPSNIYNFGVGPSNSNPIN